jgi:hypothetical protein
MLLLCIYYTTYAMGYYLDGVMALVCQGNIQIWLATTLSLYTSRVRTCWR